MQVTRGGHIRSLSALTMGTLVFIKTKVGSVQTWELAKVDCEYNPQKEIKFQNASVVWVRANEESGHSVNGPGLLMLISVGEFDPVEGGADINVDFVTHVRLQLQQLRCAHASRSGRH